MERPGRVKDHLAVLAPSATKHFYQNLHETSLAYAWNPLGIQRRLQAQKVFLYRFLKRPLQRVQHRKVPVTLVSFAHALDLRHASTLHLLKYVRDPLQEPHPQ